MKASDGGPVELINGSKGEGREKKKEGNAEIRRRGVRADVRGRLWLSCTVADCLCFCLLKYCLVAVFHFSYCTVLII